MAKTRVIQVPNAKAPFEMIEREMAEPKRGYVRLNVEACGICHSDVSTKEGLWPGVQYPRIPGHEVAGVIDAIGDGVQGWNIGDRVGVGWHGGHCAYCERCRRADFLLCKNGPFITGI